MVCQCKGNPESPLWQRKQTSEAGWAGGRKQHSTIVEQAAGATSCRLSIDATVLHSTQQHCAQHSREA